MPIADVISMIGPNDWFKRRSTVPGTEVACVHPVEDSDIFLLLRISLRHLDALDALIQVRVDP